MIFLKNYKSLAFVVFLFLVALIMLSYSAKYGQGGGVFKNIVLETAAPLQSVLNSSVTTVSDAWKRYVFLVGLEEENKKLNKFIGYLQSELITYREGYLDAQRLGEILALKKSVDYPSVAARVIAKDQAALSKTILIDKGSAHGLKKNMPVLVPSGLAGRLIDVSWHVSKALLLIDENSNVDAMLQRTRAQGIASGAGYRGCVLKYITRDQSVAEGDVVISSGMGGVFPKGLLIGAVSQVEKPHTDLFLNIRIAPFVDFSKLEEVIVLITEDGK
ncbi:MAG TPA: rod shape-determining protein MreC [Deltaproteobacteria bacterium]|nr:rod shape-determining protein MreC [Deltaproteobacteria bacterium]